MHAVAQVLDIIGRVIARYLERPVQGYDPFTPSDPVALRKSLEPGDVLLVEGNSHISRVIKYLTQSTWSHAALYVGPIVGANTKEGEPHVLIEAELGQGVISAPLSKYYRYHTRICRPIGLSLEDRRTVCSYVIDRIGFDYDLRNIIDLMRYLFPLPVPQRWRRRAIALGSGNPTRLLGAHRASFRGRPLSDSTKNYAARKRGGAAEDFGDPPFVALRAARFRYLAVLPDRQTDPGRRVQL
jgi:hypothetical protein